MGGWNEFSESMTFRCTEVVDAIDSMERRNKTLLVRSLSMGGTTDMLSSTPSESAVDELSRINDEKQTGEQKTKIKTKSKQKADRMSLLPE